MSTAKQIARVSRRGPSSAAYYAMDWLAVPWQMLFSMDHFFITERKPSNIDCATHDI